ncbi:unnamed protein product [Polarella glacialis]|uniref:Uncharacterized protein n=1 Tax=Polarella glacialis TaxID=89957 RepID=A0A813JT65_POLGL|nr:unnamed protein product [Polarella glacialis]|mmetsp:Transcript_61212/g.110253  ORF Transcript_61212/g.110253 Transcript_61212/m.110253 type:complete len:171 (-) Transcript_61212:72-584(-)
MGAEASTLCSVDRPVGYEAEHAPSLPEFFSKATSSCAAGRSSSRIEMEIATPGALKSERINMWSKNLGEVGDTFGPRLASALSCDEAISAPEEYLADTQDGHCIIMDSREGPTFMDLEDDDRQMRPDQGECVVDPAAVVMKQKRQEANQKKASKEKSTLLKAGQAGLNPF